MELDEVDPPERGGVLVLHPPLDLQLHPLDVVGALGDLVGAEGQPQQLHERAHEGDHNRRG